MIWTDDPVADAERWYEEQTRYDDREERNAYLSDLRWEQELERRMEQEDR